MTIFSPAAMSVRGLIWAAPASAAALPALAQQQNLGEVASTVTGQIGALGQFVGAGAVFVGVIMLVMAAVKFRAYSSNPQDPSASITGACGFAAAGAALIAFPELMGVGVTTLFGGDSATGDLGGGFMSDLGGG